MFYKYMERRFAESFFETGSMKLGTLYDYQNNKKYNEAVGDENEGLHLPFMKKNGPIFHDSFSPQESAFIGNSIVMSPGNTIGKLEIHTTVKHPDCYIYCVATEKSRMIMEAFKCDTCIEIFDMDLFINQIARKTREFTALYPLKTPIHYMNKSYSFEEDIQLNPATTKDLKYAYQKEIRVIWAPNRYHVESNEISPIIFSAPRARNFCRLVNV